MKISSERVERKDVAIGTIIALIMGTTFAYVGGKPLIVTFIPGLIIAWGILLWFHISDAEVPTGTSMYPLYFGALAWQFIHFTEEFATGFRLRFFPLYGHAVIGNNLFVGINMFSYFMFAVGFILAFRFKLRFFLQPTAFFIVYGVIGNAISHVVWVLLTGGYFPGFFTALGYWIIGPPLLASLLGSYRRAALAIGCFAVILVPAITFARERNPANCAELSSPLCGQASSSAH